MIHCYYCTQEINDGEKVIIKDGHVLHEECRPFYVNKRLSEYENRPFKCPECEGSGKSKEFIDVYPAGLPDSGTFDSRTWEECTCGTCSGHGYTEKELKPVMGIVGYK